MKNIKSNKPIIGVVLDWKEQGSFSNYPHYAMEKYHFDAINKAGGIPIALPLEKNFVNEYTNMIDGLLIPGGFFPFPNDWYTNSSDEVIPPEHLIRPNFEANLIEKVLGLDVPFLGICAGIQSLCAVTGGKLHKNIHLVYKTSIDHLKEKPTAELCHDITIEKNSLLHKIINEDKIMVNSHHNEGVSELPEILKISATAPDGVIEAIEMPDKKFVLGVQWHPEYFLEENSPHLKIFKAFVEACKE